MRGNSGRPGEIEATARFRALPLIRPRWISERFEEFQQRFEVGGREIVGTKSGAFVARV